MSLLRAGHDNMRAQVSQRLLTWTGYVVSMEDNRWIRLGVRACVRACVRVHVRVRGRCVRVHLLVSMFLCK